MRRTLCLATAFFSLALPFAGTVARAQQQTTPPATHRHHFRKHEPHQVAMHLEKRLNLSQDQTARLEPILAEQQQKFKALRADSSLTPDARKQQMQELRKITREQFASVLTPEQMEQMKTLRHGHRFQHRQGQTQPAGV